MYIKFQIYRHTSFVNSTIFPSIIFIERSAEIWGSTYSIKKSISINNNNNVSLFSPSVISLKNVSLYKIYRVCVSYLKDKFAYSKRKLWKFTKATKQKFTVLLKSIKFFSINNRVKIYLPQPNQLNSR